MYVENASTAPNALELISIGDGGVQKEEKKQPVKTKKVKRDTKPRRMTRKELDHYIYMAQFESPDKTDEVRQELQKMPQVSMSIYPYWFKAPVTQMSELCIGTNFRAREIPWKVPPKTEKMEKIEKEREEKN